MFIVRSPFAACRGCCHFGRNAYGSIFGNALTTPVPSSNSRALPLAYASNSALQPPIS